MFGRFLKFSVILALFPVVVFGAQAPNPRGGNARNTASSSNEANVEKAIRRSATTVIARSVEKNGRKNRTVVKARPASAVSARATVARVAARDSNHVVSSTANVSRAAVGKKSSNIVRSAKNNNVVRSAAPVNVSRAGSARATAVFNDVSKIGGGYAACRDSYATCMDQFCAVANDAYRRCFCSERFVSFRNTSDSLDQALSMLADFQNKNLDAVNKTAAEVNAMYTASEGEAAIKRDTSASQKLLDDIGELLSGNKRYKKATAVLPASTGTLNISSLFSSNSGDVFSGDSIFDSDSGSLFSQVANSNSTNMSDLEGEALFNAANRQCSAVSHSECSSDAMFNLARSAYSVMITQDCNLYEKNINAKKESVQETVRTAEKYLRDARLEEYRAHNSPDVNSCLEKVETAIRQSTACGENYERCLDYTGRYINSTTGEPIYSKALFDLNNLIVLDGSADVVGANSGFSDFLEDKKMFVTQALDTCREIADVVWAEFKRSAIIQIAQAQDEKIEEIKNSCVQTISSCYDTQTGSLAKLATKEITTTTGAISAIAAHDMCKDQVLACAALYGDPTACVYNDQDKTLKDNGTGSCGLSSLLAYVNTVDSIKVAKGCEASLREYAEELCSEGDDDYPWGCRLYSLSKLEKLLKDRAELVCGGNLIAASSNRGGRGGSGDATGDKAAKHNRVIKGRAAQNTAPTATSTDIGGSGGVSGGGSTNYQDIDQNLIEGFTDSSKAVNNILSNITKELTAALSGACYKVADEGDLRWVSRIDGNINGVYYGNRSGLDKDDVLEISPGWMKSVFGTDSDLKYLGINYYYVHGFKISIPGTGLTKEMWSNSESRWLSTGWGVCIKPPVRLLCVDAGGTFDSANNKCTLSSDWFKNRCEELGGYVDSGNCYLK